MEIKQGLKFAVPSKGRLLNETSALLRSAGVDFSFGERQLSAIATIPDAREVKQTFTLGLMRPKDIVTAVATAKIQLGIVGTDTLTELALQTSRSKDRWGIPASLGVRALFELGIGGCDLVFAAPRVSGYKDAAETYLDYTFLKQFDDKTIATSYPEIVEKCFEDELGYLNYYRDWETWDIKRTYITLGGSIEAAPGLELADIVADLIETGDTLEANELMVLGRIGSYQAALITNETYRKRDNPLIDLIKNKIAEVAKTTPYARERRRRFNTLVRRVVKWGYS